MVNRVLEQKKLKMKRRHRYAVFSGASAKYAIRVDTGRQSPDGKHVTIPVGEINLSKQVMSTGRGPNQERMVEYYNRLHSFLVEVPPTLGCTEPIHAYMERYKEILKETKEMRICLVDNALGRLDLFFKSGGNEWFFVDIDYKKSQFRRSRIYGSKQFALTRLRMKMVTWVEYLPKKTT